MRAVTIVDDGAVALSARSALLYHVYAQAVDDEDLDTLRGLVTEDIGITRGGREEAGGVEAFLDIYRAHASRGFDACQHAVTNVVARREGSRIETRAAFQARLFSSDECRLLIGEYADTHLETDSGLKIAHKRILVKKVLRQQPAEDLFTYAGTSTAR